MTDRPIIFSAPMVRALLAGRKALGKIAAFGDPYEIADDPEEFGGTNDGCETVCMAYENMQSIARTALTDATNQGEG